MGLKHKTPRHHHQQSGLKLYLDNLDADDLNKGFKKTSGENKAMMQIPLISMPPFRMKEKLHEQEKTLTFSAN